MIACISSTKYHVRVNYFFGSDLSYLGQGFVELVKA